MMRALNNSSVLLSSQKCGPISCYIGHQHKIFTLRDLKQQSKVQWQMRYMVRPYKVRQIHLAVMMKQEKKSVTNQIETCIEILPYYLLSFNESQGWQLVSRICKRRGILFKILCLLFFIEVQPTNRHGESTSTASNLSHKINKVPLLLRNSGWYKVL